MKTTKTLWFAILWMLVFGLSVLTLSARPIRVTVIAKTNFVTEDKDRVKIKAEELPQGIKTTLGTDAFKGWSVVNAYKIKSGEEYEVELKKGDTTQLRKFDKDGKVK